MLLKICNIMEKLKIMPKKINYLNSWLISILVNHENYIRKNYCDLFKIFFQNIFRLLVKFGKNVEFYVFLIH